MKFGLQLIFNNRTPNGEFYRNLKRMDRALKMRIEELDLSEEDIQREGFVDENGNNVLTIYIIV